jgi:hypothetical protein
MGKKKNSSTYPPDLSQHALSKALWPFPFQKLSLYWSENQGGDSGSGSVCLKQPRTREVPQGRVESPGPPWHPSRLHGPASALLGTQWTWSVTAEVSGFPIAQPSCWLFRRRCVWRYMRSLQGLLSPSFIPGLWALTCFKFENWVPRPRVCPSDSSH